MTRLKTQIQKTISVILLFAFVVPSFVFLAPPKKAEAQFTDFVGAIQRTISHSFQFINATADTASMSLGIKEFAREILRMTLQKIALRALSSMTQSTVNWINSGFHGKPLFLENPKSFFTDITKFEIKNMINIMGFDTLRYPYAKNYLLGVIGSYQNQLSQNAQHSLANVINDPYVLAQYNSNFSVGGWDGFINITQDPQNNALGFNVGFADNFLASKLGNEIGKVNRVLLEGQGFLSPQDCPSNPSLNARNPYKVQPFDPNTIPYNPPYTQAQVDYAQQTGDPNWYQMSLALDSYNFQHNQQLTQAKAAWDASNTCPGGWRTTTPGSVAASKIMTAVNMPEQNGIMNAALGNSMSAIFDSLLNKFIGDGLTKLVNKVNNTSADPFSYYGVSLDNTSTTDPGWSGLAIEEVILDDFKKEVSGKSQVKDSLGAVIAETIGNCAGQTITVSPQVAVTCGAGTAPNGVITGTASVTQSGTTTTGTFEYIPGAKIMTALELRMLDDTQPSNADAITLQTINILRPVASNANPGLMQIIDRMWPVAYSIDQCLPGPNKDWEKRLDEERDRVFNTKLATETGNDDVLKSKAATEASRDLRNAVQSFKDWIMVKMVTPISQGGLGLPNSTIFEDAVRSMDDTAQQLEQLTKSRRDKISALARMISIESQLAPFLTQPTKGTPQEKRLINIRTQYLSIQSSASSVNSLENIQGELDLATEKLSELRAHEVSCIQERTAAGWAMPGGSSSRLTTTAPSQYYIVVPGISLSRPLEIPVPYTGTELELFCSVPIHSGSSHGRIIRNDLSARFKNCPTCSADPNIINGWYSFRNPLAISRGTKPPQPNDPLDRGLVGYQDLLLVNATMAYGDNAGRYPISIDIDCKSIFETTINSYKHAGESKF